MEGHDTPGEVPFDKLGDTGLVHHPRIFHIYSVSEAELDNLFSEAMSVTISIGVSSSCLGVFVTLLTFLLAGNIESQSVQAASIGATIAAGVLLVAFGLQAAFGLRRRGEQLKRIKQSE